MNLRLRAAHPEAGGAELVFEQPGDARRELLEQPEPLLLTDFAQATHYLVVVSLRLLALVRRADLELGVDRHFLPQGLFDLADPDERLRRKAIDLQCP